VVAIYEIYPPLPESKLLPCEGTVFDYPPLETDHRVYDTMLVTCR